MIKIISRIGVGKIIIIILIIIILMNIQACFHAYRFTHFTKSNKSNPTDSNSLKLIEKVKVLFFGIENPRPENVTIPAQKYETVYLESNKRIQCWKIDVMEPKGQIAIFHGYSGNKSSMIDIANEFLDLDFSVLLVDFMGSGGSAGNQTTIGYFESDQVKSCYDYLKRQNNSENIYLYGTSMGAVAILKAIKDYNIEPTGIMVECPYGSMYQAVRNRFRNMGLPSLPFAPLLVFWGGIQNGFWGFSHDTVEYAKHVRIPTLVLRGEQDFNVTETEIQDIYSNLKGKKVLKEYENTGHVNIYSKNTNEWKADVLEFFRQIR